jgi:hypothetical protein
MLAMPSAVVNNRARANPGLRVKLLAEYRRLRSMLENIHFPPAVGRPLVDRSVNQPSESQVYPVVRFGFSRLIQSAQVRYCFIWLQLRIFSCTYLGLLRMAMQKSE